MNQERVQRAVRVATAVILSLAVLNSCASKPKTAVQSVAKIETPTPPKNEVPTVEVPVPLPIRESPGTASAGTAGTGTALKTADPAVLARNREEREAIEASIVFGSPSSLAKAREFASQATAIKPEDAAVLDAIARGIASLAYPEAADPSRPASSPAAAVFSGAGQVLLKALDEAAAGHFPTVPAESAGSPLGELIPALVLFATDSSDSTRLAFEALDRFARLAVPSIMPSIIRGVDAERRGDWQGALGLYRSALAIAPDAWSAALGAGRAFLALRRSADALAILSPLAQAHSGLPAFDRFFGLALNANGRYQESDPYVARVLTRDPQDSKFILIRARLLVRAKAYQQALPLLDAYGTVDPTNRLYLLLRCLESEGLRARDEALKWARRGLAAYNDDPELLVAASRILFSGPAFGREEARTLAVRVCDMVVSGAAAPAESDFEAGAVILAARNAASVEASRLLALDASVRFKWADAFTYLSRAGTSFEDKALAARILRKSGNVRLALDFASEWYRGEPRSEGATEAYLRALVDSGDEKLAQETIARLLPGTLSTSLRSLLYYLQSRLQKSDEAALSLLRAALVENADNPEALAAVSDIQLRRKDFAKARFYLKQAIATDPGNPELEERQRQLDAASPP